MARDVRPDDRTTEDVPRCQRHGVRTRLTCVDCGAPICPKCMTRTEVGLKCEIHAAPAVTVPAGRSRRGLLVAAGVVLAGLVAVLGALYFAGSSRRGGEPTARRGPPIGRWERAPALGSIRGSTTAVALPDGRMLVVGGGVGSVPVGATETFDSGAGEWTAGPDLLEPRRGHQAVVLEDGRVLVAGGIASGTLLSSAELLDADGDRWSRAGAMRTARLGHTLTVLADGSVLAAGGTVESGTAGEGAQSIAPSPSAEVFDPDIGRWTSVGDMLAGRFEATATRLADGRVLIAGGMGLEDGRLVPLTSAELYDPATRTFVRADAMAGARANAAAVLLEDGSVLVIGGDAGRAPTGTVERFDPSRGTWSQAASLARARRGHTAVVLPDGTVLIAGGESFSDGTRTSLASAERYDPATDEWRNAGDMACPRSEQGAALLGDGSAVQVAGDAAFPGQPPIAQSCVDRYAP